LDEVQPDAPDRSAVGFVVNLRRVDSGARKGSHGGVKHGITGAVGWPPLSPALSRIRANASAFSALSVISVVIQA
jgi:hypothetical protein